MNQREEEHNDHGGWRERELKGYWVLSPLSLAIID